MSTSGEGGFADAVLSETIRQAQTDPSVRRGDLRYDTVTAVNIDGTVSVGDIRARRYTAYTLPAVGDQVVLMQSGNRNWIALGRLVPATDTGSWTTFTLGAGMTHPGHGAVPAYLVEGKKVTLRGRVGGSGGAAIADGATILTLPAAIRPAGAVSVSWASPRNAPMGANPQPNLCRVDIVATTGVIRTFEAGNPPGWISLDGVSYYTD